MVDWELEERTVVTWVAMAREVMAVVVAEKGVAEVVAVVMEEETSPHMYHRQTWQLNRNLQPQVPYTHARGIRSSPWGMQYSHLRRSSWLLYPCNLQHAECMCHHKQWRGD